MLDREAILDLILDALIKWEQFKGTRPNSQPSDKLGESPLSQESFLRNTWRVILPECKVDPGQATGAFDWAKAKYRSPFADAEAMIETTFQSLLVSGIITLASSYETESGVSQFGLNYGGTRSHQFELSRRAAQQALSDKEGFLTMMQLPSHFAHLSESLGDFLKSQGPYNTNVFLIMPFGKDTELATVQKHLKSHLAAKGHRLYRADDKEYEGALWENICVPMLGCRRAIALFKNVGGRPFNHNVAIEMGFMLALGKKVLVLKDTHLPTMPVDLIHRLYHDVEFSDLTAVTEEVDSWL